MGIPPHPIIEVRLTEVEIEQLIASVLASKIDFEDWSDDEDRLDKIHLLNNLANTLNLSLVRARLKK